MTASIPAGADASARTVTRLLDGAIERAHRAERLLASNDAEGVRQAVDSALGIVDVLRNALDRDTGGDLATTLDYVYAYAEMRLLEGREQQRREPFAEAARLLDTIAAGWRAMRLTPVAAAA